MRKLLLIIFVLALQTSVLSQMDSMTCSLKLSGRVIDEHDQSALELATVYIVELNRSSITDEKGNYSFIGICSGVYTIKIQHLNCEPIQARLEISKNTVKNFYPEHHAELLKDVEVTVGKLPSQSTQTENEVTGEKLNQSKGLSLGEALKNITGVASLNTGNSISKPIINGMHSNRILILNNGIRQEGQQWGVEHAPELDPFIAGKLSVVKGANSVRYGSDAIAGVVLVEPKPHRDSLGIGAELSTVGNTNGRGITSSAMLEGRLKNYNFLSWRLQGTFKQNGNVSAPNYIMVNTGQKEYNFSYSLALQKQKYGLEIFYSQFNTTLGIFSAAHIGNLTDLQRAFQSPVPLETGDFTYDIKRPYQHIEHELFKVKAHLFTGNKGKLSFVYARQYNLRNEYDKHRPLNDSLALLNKPELQFELTTHTADLFWEHNSFNKLTGSIGVSGITQGNTYEGRALIPNFANKSIGAFWIERLKKKQFELEAGLRYDIKSLEIYKYRYIGNGSYELINPIHDFQNISGNLGAIYKKDSTVNVSINVGSAWRSPSVNELYSDGLHHGAAAMEYGNNALKLERTYNSIFTFRYNNHRRLNLEVSPYIHYIENFIYRQPATLPVVTIRGAFPAFNYKQTNALLRGCDIFLSYQLIKNLEFTGKVSLIRSWNLTEKNWLVLMPSDRCEGELIYRFKPTNVLTSSYISGSVLHVTKQWRVPSNSDFVAPPAAYTTFNLHTNFTFKIKKQTIDAGLSVLNLLNQTYRDYLDRFRYFTDAMGRNVVLRISYKF